MRLAGELAARGAERPLLAALDIPWFCKVEPIDVESKQTLFYGNTQPPTSLFRPCLDFCAARSVNLITRPTHLNFGASGLRQELSGVLPALSARSPTRAAPRHRLLGLEHDSLIEPPASPPGADGWLEDAHLPSINVRETLQVWFKKNPKIGLEERAARARVMSLFFHMSVFFGIPVFLVAFVKRDDPFALHHAKAAAVSFLTFYAALFIAFQGSMFAFGVCLLAYIPALFAIWAAAGGHHAGVLGWGHVGEILFFPIKAKKTTSTRQISAHPDPVELLDVEELAELVEIARSQRQPPES